MAASASNTHEYHGRTEQLRLESNYSISKCLSMKFLKRIRTVPNPNIYIY